LLGCNDELGIDPCQAENLLNAQSDANARRGCHSGVRIVQPTALSTAAEHSNHLTDPQFIFDIVVLRSNHPRRVDGCCNSTCQRARDSTIRRIETLHRRLASGGRSNVPSAMRSAGFTWETIGALSVSGSAECDDCFGVKRHSRRSAGSLLRCAESWRLATDITQAFVSSSQRSWHTVRADHASMIGLQRGQKRTQCPEHTGSCFHEATDDCAVSHRWSELARSRISYRNYRSRSNALS
jgi:hypothetical protein